jgi:predicted transposase/invertase (TIGR01784 family)
MILGIDPKVDYAFKHLLGREATRPLLINMINSVLNPPPGHQLQDIELLNPFNPKETLDDKLSILDIKARDQLGRQFNVEMQMLAYRYYEKRILYYGCKLHQQQLHEGHDYVELKPTISISFLDHVLFPQVSDYHLCFQLLEKRRHFALTEDMEFHLMELPKFAKPLAELSSELDAWLYFLRHAGTMDMAGLPEVFKQYPLVLRALEELQMLAQSDAERERYEARRKAQLDINTGMKVARMEGREEGEKIGREEGEKIGREEGEKIGRAKGEKIGIIHFCERLLQKPETPAAQLANLSLEELTRLADELQAQALQQR